MKKLLAVFGITLLSISVMAQATDTLGYSQFLEGTETLYTSPNGGFAFGNNGYGDKAKAQTFSNDQPHVIEKVLLKFGAVQFGSQDSTSAISVNFYSNTGLGITTFSVEDTLAPDTITSSVSVPVYQLVENGLTEVDFGLDTLVFASDELYTVGIDLTQLAVGDTVGLLSTTDGDAVDTYNAWELTANDNWIVVASSAYSWNLDVDMGIFVVIDENDPAGIDHLESLPCLIYPNPVSDLLHVSVTSVLKNRVDIEIYTASGTLIQRTSTKNNLEVLDLSELANGLYVLKLTSKSASTVKRFIINHN